MAYVMVDVETDGPIPGDYSMVSLGAVCFEKPELTFYRTIKPISEKWDAEALSISGFSRETTMTFQDPVEVMEDFEFWAKNLTIEFPGQLIFISDNNGFDWMFVCWYFWHFLNRNPFGHTSQNLGSIYKGMLGNMRKSFKHLRTIKHSHNSLEDAVGNVGAMYKMPIIWK